MELVIIDGFHLRIQTAGFWDGCWRRNGGGEWAYEEWEMGRVVVCLTSVACKEGGPLTDPFHLQPTCIR